MSVPATNDEFEFEFSVAASAFAACVTSPSLVAAVPLAVDRELFSRELNGLVGSCVMRSRSCVVWLPFCRSPMTLTTSAKLIGLACVGTATSSKRLATVLTWRKMRFLMWFWQLPPEDFGLFNVASGTQKIGFKRHYEDSLP